MKAKPCWNNCAAEADDEIRRIDAMEDALSPLSMELKRVRGLITSLEMCHHKAERWVLLIVEAIAKGETDKGPGTGAKDSRHPWIRRSVCSFDDEMKTPDQALHSDVGKPRT
jgi:hypothetical protein